MVNSTAFGIPDAFTPTVTTTIAEDGAESAGVILTYHEIVDQDSPYIYSVTKASLQSHLSLCRGMTETGPDGSTPYEITFDDGHISHYQAALPLLEEAGVKATFCVTAGWTDQDRNYMTRGQLRELLAYGHRIFAHGWTHSMLTRCTPAELYQEVWGAKQFMEDVLGAPVSGISAPHGRWNERVLETCADAGYSHLYTSDPHIRPTVRHGIRLAGRFMVRRQSSAESLAQLSRAYVQKRGWGDLVQGTKRAVRTVIGEDRYRKLWRHFGDKTQDLPHVPGGRSRLAVLQLISSGGYYGAESMLLNLSQTLTSQNVDIVVGVFANSQNPHTEVAERARKVGIETRIISCNGRWDRCAIEEIRRLIYTRGIDIVHSHGSKANAYAAFAVGRLPVSRVATYHIDWPDRGLLLRLYHLLDRVILRGFDSIVAVSEPIRASLHASGIRRNKIAVIKNGIDLTPFIQKDSTRPPKGSGEMRLIGVIGRLTPQKGHQFLLAAIPGVLERYPNISFLFVGDGPELANLQHQVSALNLEKHVVFAGSRDDMPNVYAALDILVLPSLNEGMPMTLIEALASKLPVLATAVGDVPKLIVDGRTGLLVRPGDPEGLKEALLNLLSDESKAADLGLSGHRVVCRDYSAANMSSQYLSIYAQLKKSHSRTALSPAEV